MKHLVKINRLWQLTIDYLLFLRLIANFNLGGGDFDCLVLSNQKSNNESIIKILSNYFLSIYKSNSLCSCEVAPLLYDVSFCVCVFLVRGPFKPPNTHTHCLLVRGVIDPETSDVRLTWKTETQTAPAPLFTPNGVGICNHGNRLIHISIHCFLMVMRRSHRADY